MSEVTTLSAPETATVNASANGVPAKTKATKRPASKSAKPASPKATKVAKPVKAAKSSGVELRARQIRILEALSKGAVLSRAEIIEKVCNGHPTNLSGDIGHNDPTVRAKKEKQNGYPSLLTLKLIGEEKINLDGEKEIAFRITKAGQSAITKGCQDARLPAPGSVITRVYKEKTYKVKVLRVGFEYDKKTYNSLTQVAKKIIGGESEINGYAFFKLTTPK